MKVRGILEKVFLGIVFLLPVASYSQTGTWNTVTEDGIIHRHENSFVELNGKFYLVGGRRLGVEKFVNIYDPASGTWSASTKPLPLELHHFQAVAYNNLIYVIGAFTGGHPAETPVGKVYTYNPSNDTWSEGHEIPEARRRGAAGAVVYNNKIYIVCGAVNGHVGDNVAWLDEYNPTTGEWKVLPDAPRARDHFQAVVSGNKLFLTGGRRSKGYFNTENKFVIQDEYIPEVDVFNFTTNSWDTSYPNVEVVRAGTASVELNGEVLLIGGESPASGSRGYAHKETSGLHIQNKIWRNLAELNTGRHATHAIVFNNKVYIASGSKANGGSTSSQLLSMEELSFGTTNPNELSHPTSVNFGEVEENESATRTITLMNPAGNPSIVINTISISSNTENSYSLVNLPTFPYTLTAGSSISINALFEPVSSGVKTATLDIQHDGANGPSAISLSGEGVLEITSVVDAYFSHVMIYPNPIRTTLSIENLPSKVSWELTSLSGQKIAEGKITNLKGETIQVNGLQSGTYVLILKSDKGNKSWLLKKD